MTERQKIQERLRRKEAEIQGLEEKIKSARVYVQALRDVLKIIDADDNAAVESTPSDTSLRPGSAVARARDVILARGTPVHIGELLDALGREATRESRASLTSSLSAYVRRGEIFSRPAPNTFGLIELGHDEVDRPVPDEPPVGFGRGPEAPTADPQSDSGDASPVDDEIPF